MTVRLVEVETSHGWGWSDTSGEAEWDFVPPPFAAQVTAGQEVWHGKTVSTLQGRIADGGHPMHGYNVMLSPRHDPWDGDVNVTLWSEDGRKLKGFGHIDQANFND